MLSKLTFSLALVLMLAVCLVATSAMAQLAQTDEVLILQKAGFAVVSSGNGGPCCLPTDFPASTTLEYDA